MGWKNVQSRLKQIDGKNPLPILASFRLYESVSLSMDKRRVSKYCLVMLSDYIAFVCAFSASMSLRGGSSSSNREQLPLGVSGGGSGDFPASLAALAALRRGAFCLLGSLSPAELQHLHMVLGGGSAAAAGAGGAEMGVVGAAGRRAALLRLRTDFDKVFKFEGKV